MTSRTSGLVGDDDATTGERKRGHAPRGELAKYLFDIVFGAVLTLAALPVIAVLALGVALSLRFWPFFVQERVGRQGRPVPIVKLRTLPSAAPRYALKTELVNVSVSSFGRFLRRHRLDELPQLALVPLGRLSLVGPRPTLPAHVEPMDENFFKDRTSVRQGCSGLWQISVDAHQLIAEAPQYDLFYLRHHSVRLDVWILWRTARLMVGLGPRIRLADVPAWTLSPPSRAVLRDTGAKWLAPEGERGCRQRRRVTHDA